MHTVIKASHPPEDPECSFSPRRLELLIRLDRTVRKQACSSALQVSKLLSEKAQDRLDFISRSQMPMWAPILVLIFPLISIPSFIEPHFVFALVGLTLQ
jgi:hypothetical protein